MKPETGQILRRIGLLLEAICLLGLISVSRTNAPPRGFAGFSVVQILTFCLAIGFFFWFVGTATIYLRRKPRNPD